MTILIYDLILGDVVPLKIGDQVLNILIKRRLRSSRCSLFILTSHLWSTKRELLLVAL
jgi:hypothetical protein